MGTTSARNGYGGGNMVEVEGMAWVGGCDGMLMNMDMGIHPYGMYTRAWGHMVG